MEQIDRQLRQPLAQRTEQARAVAEGARRHGRKVKGSRREQQIVPACVLIHGRHEAKVVPALFGDIQQHKADVLFSRKRKRFIRAARIIEHIVRQSLAAARGKGGVAVDQDLRLFVAEEQRPRLVRQRICLHREAQPLQALHRIGKAVLAPEAADLEHLVFEEQLRLRAQCPRVDRAALTEQQRRGKQLVGGRLDAVLRFKEAAEAVKLPRTDPLKVMGREVVEQQRPAGGEAAGDGGGEKRFLCARVKLCLQRAQQRLARYAGGVLPRVALIERAPRVAGEDDDGVAEADILAQIAVREASRVQNLQKQLDRVEVCLFDLVKEQDAVRVLFDEARQQSLLRAGVAFLETHQPHV